jgi:cytochrome c
MFTEVAKKYRDVPGALEASIKRVREGSTGVWGKVAMLPHAQHTPEQVGEMVRYVYSIQADANSKTVGGLNNTIEVTADLSGVQLEAFYTDLGRGPIPALTGSQTVRLRSRVVQAEQVDSISKAKVLNSARAQGKAFVGAIESGAILRLNGITLTKVSQIIVRVASAGQGGFIEVHRDKVDGELLGRVDVAVNGDWEAFSELTIALDGQKGTHDLFFVFKNEKGGGGLMNIDSIEFRK